MASSRFAFRRLFFVIGAALAVVLVAAACGGSSGAKSSNSSSSNTVKVSEKEWSITVAGTEMTKGQGNAKVSAGTVTFDVTDNGSVAHAFEINGNGVDQKTDTIEPGKSATLKVDLKAGKYEVFCPISGHKQLGMDGFVTAS